ACSRAGNSPRRRSGGSELVNALEAERLHGFGGGAVRVDENGVVRPLPANLAAQFHAAVRQVGQRSGYLVVLRITGGKASRAEVKAVLVVEHLRTCRQTPLPVEVRSEERRVGKEGGAGR